MIMSVTVTVGGDTLKMEFDARAMSVNEITRVLASRMAVLLSPEDSNVKQDNPIDLHWSCARNVL